MSDIIDAIFCQLEDGQIIFRKSSVTNLAYRALELREEAKKLQARLAALEEATRWVPVGEGNIPMGKEIEIWARAVDPGGEVVYGWTSSKAWYQGGDPPDCWLHNFYTENVEVSHWRKLDPGPDAPEKDGTLRHDLNTGQW